MPGDEHASSMSHDFLTSLHSTVIVGLSEKPTAAANTRNSIRIKTPEEASKTEDDRHRTVGVSMSPRLRERAALRAKALGLPFSRYVQWCVEAELDGSSLGDRFKS